MIKGYQIIFSFLLGFFGAAFIVHFKQVASFYVIVISDIEKEEAEKERIGEGMREVTL